MKIKLPPKRTARKRLTALGQEDPLFADTLETLEARFHITKDVAAVLFDDREVELADLLLLTRLIDETAEAVEEEEQKNPRPRVAAPTTPPEMPPALRELLQRLGIPEDRVRLVTTLPGGKGLGMAPAPTPVPAPPAKPEVRLMRTLPDGEVLAPDGYFLDEGVECEDPRCTFHQNKSDVPASAIVDYVHSKLLRTRGNHDPRAFDEALELLQDEDVKVRVHPRGFVIQKPERLS